MAALRYRVDVNGATDQTTPAGDVNATISGVTPDSEYFVEAHTVDEADNVSAAAASFTIRTPTTAPSGATTIKRIVAGAWA